MLAYIRYDNCVVRSVGVNSFNNLLRINIIINLILNERAFPIVDFGNPLIVLNLVNSFGKKRQNLFKIAVNMIMRNNIFIHFGRVYINMDNCQVVALLHGGNGTVADSRAEKHQRVACVYSSVRCLAAVHTEHSVEQRGIRRHCAKSHHG